MAQASAAGSGRLPGAVAFKACAGAGAYWPTMTLALDRGSAWVACKEQARVVRVNTKTRTSRTVAAPRRPRDRRRRRLRIDLGARQRLDPDPDRSCHRPGHAAHRAAAAAAYNIWLGGGSVWVADDQGGQVIRVSRAGAFSAGSRSATARPTWPSPAQPAWVINHRDRKLFTIDLPTNTPTLVAVIPGDAPERMVMVAGGLWITGRGTDLLQVDPSTGAVKATVEIGAERHRRRRDRGALWVPVRSAVVDPTGLPDDAGAPSRHGGDQARADRDRAQPAASTCTASVRRAAIVWLADNRAGVLYRIAG